MNLLAGGGMETVEPSTPSALSTDLPKLLDVGKPVSTTPALMGWVSANWIWILLVILIILGIFFFVRNRKGAK